MKRTLVYDIETLPLTGRFFGLGKQVVRHGQLLGGSNMTQIICIQYKWVGDKNTKVLTWNPSKDKDSSRIIDEFGKLVEKADVVIGKNNKRFDDKHINAHRMINGQEPMPWWRLISDDLEQQMRRYFNFPSQSLDYISDLMGLGGKDKTEFRDWVNIDEYFKVLTCRREGMSEADITVMCRVMYKKKKTDIIRNGKASLKVMTEYGKKDVDDTEAIYLRVLPYCTFKHRKGEDLDYCEHCEKITDNKPERNAKQLICGTWRQRWRCAECRRYKGVSTIKKDGTPGRMMY